ncbi:MAG TPA: FmdB family zinc ribbon protein [Euzebyales bacterium]|nr:FmdB family zinc ribbon protein [Euzebyales bacterium]
MPTYEYACRDCGHHLEVVQSFTDDPLQTCERCTGRLRKVFSAAGIIFKGSGYYVTDTRAKASSSSGSDTASKSDTSSGSDTSGSSSEGTSSTSESSSSGGAESKSA